MCVYVARPHNTTAISESTRSSFDKNTDITDYISKKIIEHFYHVI